MFKDLILSFLTMVFIFMIIITIIPILIGVILGYGSIWVENMIKKKSNKYSG